MKIVLPDEKGFLSPYQLRGMPIEGKPLNHTAVRTVLSAVHVVADPYSADDRAGRAAVDWDATLRFREHISGLGLGIAEAMDTSQRSMGLDWPQALELITRTKQALPDALVFNGAGTDQLDPLYARSLDDVKKAYCEQIEAIQNVGGRIIIMASRAMARVATSADDYIKLYSDILAVCDRPVILHWLGTMFDPALKGYWGSDRFDEAMRTVLTIMADNLPKIDGIKISLLDKDKEIVMRRQLPQGSVIYTGDDFHYPELIEGDEMGYSHALLGIFDPLAAAAAKAITQLSAGDTKGFRETLDPTVPLARQIFRAPTQYYKTGVVFLAWLNGFQDHFIMLGGAQSARPLPDFVEIFKMADGCGLLRDPDLAIERMQKLLAVYGV